MKDLHDGVDHIHAGGQGNECVVWTIEHVHGDENSGTLELSAGCDASQVRE